MLVLGVTLPLFALIALGYLATRFGLVEASSMRSFGRFVLHLAMPALLFRILAGRGPGGAIDGGFVLAYGGATLGLLLLAVLLRLRGRGLSAAAIHGLGMAQPNSAFIGFPIAYQLVGEPAVVVFALLLLIENALVIPAALALAEAGAQQGSVRRRLTGLAIGLLRNPLLLAIAAGLLVAQLGLTLPAVLGRILDLLGASAAPVALFAIGGTLVGVRVAGNRADVAWIAGGKLLFHPLLVWSALRLVPGLDPLQVTAAVVFAAAPMLSVYPMLGQRFGLERVCSLALLVSTVASFLTISVLLALLGVVPGP